MDDNGVIYMSKGTKFLIDVTDKLKLRIQEIDETIQDVQKDIAGMNEYYWENYECTDRRKLETTACSRI